MHNSDCCAKSYILYVIHMQKILGKRNPLLLDKQLPPTHQDVKRGYSFPRTYARGPFFMTRDWGGSYITDSEGQRFLGNQHKDCGTMLQVQTLLLSWSLCRSSRDPHGIPRPAKHWCDKSKATYKSANMG